MSSAFAYGDIVFLKTDTEQLPRMITAMTQRHKFISFELSSGTYSTWHMAAEISHEKDILIGL